MANKEPEEEGGEVKSEGQGEGDTETHGGAEEATMADQSKDEGR